MSLSRRLRFNAGCLGAVFVGATRLCAQTDRVTAEAGGNLAALALGGVGAVLGCTALVMAFRAKGVADHAAQEASTARLRAQDNGQLTPETLAAAERMWAAKFSAIEAQLHGNSRPAPNRAAPREVMNPSGTAGGDVSARLLELEKVVAGISVKISQPSRRPAQGAAGPEAEWPSVLGGESSGMQEVRAALGQALKANEPAARELMDKLRVAERWASAKPATSDVAASLVEISSLLMNALRKGGEISPLDRALHSDRVLAAMRPLWKPLHAHLDCRSFLPGTTFDPEWMEDHSSGQRRPVISEMLSWAVFEKNDAKRRLLAKAHVSAD